MIFRWYNSNMFQYLFKGSKINIILTIRLKYAKRMGLLQDKKKYKLKLIGIYSFGGWIE